MLTAHYCYYWRLYSMLIEWTVNSVLWGYNNPHFYGDIVQMSLFMYILHDIFLDTLFYFHLCALKMRQWSGVWLMAVISTLWEAKVGRSLEVRSLRPAWPTWWNSVSTKNTEITWVWWCMPVIPSTWEAEVPPLEPRRQRLQMIQDLETTLQPGQ